MPSVFLAKLLALRPAVKQATGSHNPPQNHLRGGNICQNRLESIGNNKKENKWDFYVTFLLRKQIMCSFLSWVQLDAYSFGVLSAHAAVALGINSPPRPPRTSFVLSTPSFCSIFTLFSSHRCLLCILNYLNIMLPRPSLLH